MAIITQVMLLPQQTPVCSRNVATKTLIIVANQVDIALSKAHLGIKKDINNKKELSMSVMDRKRRVYG